MSPTSKSVPAPVLVVGCGFLGERFAAELLTRGLETVILTRSDPGPVRRRELAGATMVIANVEGHELRTVLPNVEHVIYTAGGLMPVEAERSPDLDASLNLSPLRFLLAELPRRPQVGLTYISSGGTIYGRPRYLPIDERHELNPISAYGRNKLAAEELTLSECARHGITLRILRCSNVYGETQPTHRGQGAVATFVDCLLHDEPAVLYGDGEVVRDYVHVDDVAKAGVDLLTRPIEPTVLNVGSGIGHSLAQVVDLINEISRGRLAVRRLPPRDFDVPAVVLDVARLRRLVPFAPLPLKAGIQRILGANGSYSLPRNAYGLSGP
jgi:UDP-glucose 4-epimerase